MAQSRWAARAVAVTEDRVAPTMARPAEAAEVLRAQDGALLLLRPQRPVARILCLLEAGHLIAAP
jgi:hypothetical protein